MPASVSAAPPSYLGLTNAQLFQQLQSGKSLAQIATSKGKTVAGLEQAMTAPIKKALDAAVARKVITAAQEKQILSRLSARLSQRINQKGLPAPKRCAACSEPARGTRTAHTAPGIPHRAPGSSRHRVPLPSADHAHDAGPARRPAAAVHAGAHGLAAALTRLSSISDGFLIAALLYWEYRNNIVMPC